MPLIFWLIRLGQWLLLKLKSLWLYLWPDRPLPRYGRKKKPIPPTETSEPIYYHHQPKPKWVRKDIIRLKALMPEAGCRTLALVFNRRFKHKRSMTVGKTWVSNTLRKHQYEIQVLRRKMKHRRPRPVPHNLVWGMDLTGKTDTQGRLHHILGILGPPL